jgi:hypothetical protein
LERERERERERESTCIVEQWKHWRAMNSVEEDDAIVDCAVRMEKFGETFFWNDVLFGA